MRLIGMGERALGLAAKRAVDRVAFGKALAANGAVLQTLGRCRVTLDGARLMTLEAARQGVLLRICARPTLNRRTESTPHMYDPNP